MSTTTLDLRINSTGAQAGARVIKRSLSDIGRATGTVKDKLLSMKTLLLSAASGWGIKKLATSFIDVAAQMEQFHLTLKTVIKDAAETERAFAWVREFAKTTPFNTDEVVEAFTLMKTVGMDTVMAVEDIVRISGDAAMVFGRSITDVASALIGMNSMTLRQFGIEVDRESSQWTAKLGDRIIETEDNITSLRRAVLELLEDAFAGGMKEAENQWRGSIRTMSSLWYEMRADIMGDAGSGGPFAALEKAVVRVKDRWMEWTEDTSYQHFLAQAQDGIMQVIQSALSGVQAMTKALGGLYDYVSSLPSTAGMGLIGAYFFGVKGAVIGTLLGATSDLIDNIRDGTIHLDTDVSMPGTKPEDLMNLAGGYGAWAPATVGGMDLSQETAPALAPMVDGVITGVQILKQEIQAAYESSKLEKDQWLGISEAVETVSNKTKALVEVASPLKDIAKTAKEHFSELAVKLSDSLGISRAEAETRIAASQAVGEATAWEIERLDERNRLQEEVRTAAERVMASTEPIRGLYDDLATRADMWTKSLTDGMASAIVQGNDLADVLQNIGKSVLQWGLSQFLGGIFPSVGGFHGGGVIGVDSPTFTRKIPRYHSGGIVGKDEVPAILQKGEMVLTRGQQEALQRREKSGTTVNNITIQACDSASFTQMLQRDKGTLEALICQSMERNDRVRKSMRNTLG